MTGGSATLKVISSVRQRQDRETGKPSERELILHPFPVNFAIFANELKTSLNRSEHHEVHPFFQTSLPCFCHPRSQLMLPQFVRGRALRNRFLTLRDAMLPVSRYPGRDFNIWWLSTGRCGTHFIRHCCKAAAGVEIGKGIGLGNNLWNDVIDIYRTDRDRFWNLKLEDYPLVKAKLNARNNYSSRVFTEIAHEIYPFSAMVYDYSRRCGRPDKLVHLIRNPIDCCQSMLKAERRDGPQGFSRRATSYFNSGDEPAVRAAKTWIEINTMCAEVASHLDDPDNVLFVRIEDLDSRTSVELLNRLGLTDIDQNRLENVFGEQFTDLRHSHMARSDLTTPGTSSDELDLIRELTRETAARFGYEV